MKKSIQKSIIIFLTIFYPGGLAFANWGEKGGAWRTITTPQRKERKKGD